MTHKPPITPFREQLTDHVRRRILCGHLDQGQRLKEAAFAEEYGVSRGSIRDTFVRLTKEGLLEATPNVGVRVAEAPSAFKRRTLVRLRRTIEGNALAQDCGHQMSMLVPILEANLDEYRLACQREALEDVVVLDMAFHRGIVEAADGGSLLDTWLPIVSQMFLRYSRHHSLIESYEEHAAIFRAMRSGDRVEAQRRLRAHIV